MRKQGQFAIVYNECRILRDAIALYIVTDEEKFRTRSETSVSRVFINQFALVYNECIISLRFYRTFHRHRRRDIWRSFGDNTCGIFSKKV